MMLARYKKIANFTFLARWANLAYQWESELAICPRCRQQDSILIKYIV